MIFINFENLVKSREQTTLEKASNPRRKINLTTGITVVSRGSNLFFKRLKLDKLAFHDSLLR